MKLTQKETNINNTTLGKFSTYIDSRKVKKAKIWKTQILNLNTVNNNFKIKEKKKVGEIMRHLMSFGYSMESIEYIYLRYKFDTLEKALFLLSKDPETNIYNHHFLSISKYQKIYGNIHTDIPNNELSHYCIICKDLDKFHKKDKFLNSPKKVNYQINLTDFPLLTKSDIVYDDDLINMLNKKDYNKEDLESMTLNKSKYNNRIYKTYIKVNTKLLENIEKNFQTKKDLCLICYTTELNEKNSFKSPCGHIFCKQCYFHYIKDKIENGVIKIKCLMAGCINILEDEIIKKFTTQNLYRKYLKFKKNKLYEENLKKGLIPCVHPDCEEWIKYKEGDDINVKCKKGHSFCAKCKNKQHKGRRCILYDRNVINLDSRIKPCPNCNYLIEKITSCNKINCNVCNFVFCWLCLNECGKFHYYIFNIRGCPGMKFSDPKTSKILNNNCFQCIWMSFSFLFTIIFLLILFGLYIFFGASYELIKFYDSKKDQSDDDNYNESNLSFDVNVVRNHRIHIRDIERQIEIKKKNNCKECFIYFLLFILGLLIQPFFLIYKLLKSLMECYRRFGCWFFMMGNY